MKNINSLKVVGTISFGNRLLDVYRDLNEPLFKATDISNMLGYSSGNTWNMLNMCEEDEKLKLPLVVAGQNRMINFVTENGLYNILSQTRTELSRGWRRVVHNELINLRKASGKDITQKFDEWNHELDNIYFDEETGILMQSVTVQGGDVIQIPYKEGTNNG
jgi:prophage antirepressor-like protein